MTIMTNRVDPEDVAQEAMLRRLEKPRGRELLTMLRDGEIDEDEFMVELEKIRINHQIVEHALSQDNQLSVNTGELITEQNLHSPVSPRPLTIGETFDLLNATAYLFPELEEEVQDLLLMSDGPEKEKEAKRLEAIIRKKTGQAVPRVKRTMPSLRPYLARMFRNEPDRVFEFEDVCDICFRNGVTVNSQRPKPAIRGAIRKLIGRGIAVEVSPNKFQFQSNPRYPVSETYFE